MHEGEPGISMSAVADTSRRTAMASADGIEVKGGRRAYHRVAAGPCRKNVNVIWVGESRGASRSSAAHLNSQLHIKHHHCDRERWWSGCREFKERVT